MALIVQWPAAPGGDPPTARVQRIVTKDARLFVDGREIALESFEYSIEEDPDVAWVAAPTYTAVLNEIRGSIDMELAGEVARALYEGLAEAARAWGEAWTNLGAHLSRLGAGEMAPLSDGETPPPPALNRHDRRAAAALERRRRR